MTDDDYTATRVYLEGGAYVRVSESIGEVSDLACGPNLGGGFIPVTDPGDGRGKLIRADRILWIEQEAEA